MLEARYDIRFGLCILQLSVDVQRDVVAELDIIAISTSLRSRQ